MSPKVRAIVLANEDKPQVVEAMRSFRPWLEQRTAIVAEPDTATLTRRAACDLPDADLAIVLGGDGTLLRQARLLLDRSITMLGINFGKLGFLAEFNLDDVFDHWDHIVSGECRVSDRMMMDVAVYPAGAPDFGDGGGQMPEPVFRAVAMNDAVVIAGPPFRMIEIELAIQPRLTGTSATTFHGDGIIVSTPSGSTAYNLAAGGPIVSPGVDAVCIAAICPQSLAFRPVVCNASCDIWLTINQANAGTELVLDGQESWRLEPAQQILVRKHPRAVRFMHNPSLNYWALLSRKMHWAVRPTRD